MMTSRRPGLGLVALALWVSSCGGPAADATGPELYDQLCASCHGDQLQGRVGPPLGAASNAADQPDTFLVETISRGRGRMPSFDLDDGQMRRLVEYLRSHQ